MRTTTTRNLLVRSVFCLSLAFAFGGCSKDSPQDICDCLDKSATDYMAKHPNLTKAKLEEDGRDIMQEISNPCEEMGKPIMKKVEAESATKQAEAQQLLQNCLNAISEKLKAVAKEGPATEEETQDDADAKADAAQDDADAKADATEDEASADEASTSDATDVDALLDDYEEAMQAYASYAKKSAAGDASAAADFSEAYQKAEEVGQELTPVQKQMTPKQVQRFARIQAQMMQTSTKMMQTK